jgi:hypothetical protein
LDRWYKSHLLKKQKLIFKLRYDELALKKCRN